MADSCWRSHKLSMVTAESRQFSSEVWPLEGYLCPSGQPHTHAQTGSANCKLPWVGYIKKGKGEDRKKLDGREEEGDTGRAEGKSEGRIWWLKYVIFIMKFSKNKLSNSVYDFPLTLPLPDTQPPRLSYSSIHLTQCLCFLSLRKVRFLLYINSGLPRRWWVPGVYKKIVASWDGEITHSNLVDQRQGKKAVFEILLRPSNRHNWQVFISQNIYQYFQSQRTSNTWVRVWSCFYEVYYLISM